MIIKLTGIKTSVVLFFLLTSCAFAQPSGDEHADELSNTTSSIKVMKQYQDSESEPPDPIGQAIRKRPLPPFRPLDPARKHDPNYVAEMWWEHLGYRSKKEAAKYLRLDKQNFESSGLIWNPPQPGNPDSVETEFEMPPDEVLFGCSYTPGYTYPGGCSDDDGNLIFDPAVHGQDVLDSIVKKQGKQGKYNKLPDGKTVPEKYPNIRVD